MVPPPSFCIDASEQARGLGAKLQPLSSTCRFCEIYGTSLISEIGLSTGLQSVASISE